MKIFAMIFMTITLLWLLIGSCRILSMTFKTFSRSVTIKNEKLAEMLIAHKNTWGIATSAEKRNKMSWLGIFSYLIFLPEIFFIGYDWWIYITTGMVGVCSAEETYLSIAGIYYIIAISRKITEANKFDKGEIW